MSWIYDRGARRFKTSEVRQEEGGNPLSRCTDVQMQSTRVFVEAVTRSKKAPNDNANVTAPSQPEALEQSVKVRINSVPISCGGWLLELELSTDVVSRFGAGCDEPCHTAAPVTHRIAENNGERARGGARAEHLIGFCTFCLNHVPRVLRRNLFSCTRRAAQGAHRRPFCALVAADAERWATMLELDPQSGPGPATREGVVGGETPSPETPRIVQPLGRKGATETLPVCEF
ncbi:hypothetical protein EDB86DRAFT_2826253 [Lactarius hatsudake]|nr:hypothetical protein EDB86DRAFT_2826253 [Lactarius hatsudake]